MARSGRLLELLQILRGHRFAVTGALLAEQLGVSLRTVYRDIRSLQAQGAVIEGEAGIGYVLKPGFLLPPLMLTEDEVEALALGVRFVAKRGDANLAQAATSLLVKIGAVLPENLAKVMQDGILIVGSPELARENLLLLRGAIRAERTISIRYRDLAGAETLRLVYPIAIGFFEQVDVLAGWCELRGDFRSFRIDRMLALECLAERYPERRHELMKRWRRMEKITLP